MYHQTTLKNGLRVICEAIPQVHSVSLGLLVGSGTSEEDPEYGGISHFVEHMLFKGTSRRNARQIAETIDAVGGQLNAFTTKEYTCYYAKLMSEHFKLGLDLLAELLTDSVLDPAEVNKERSVILEELKSFEDSPDELIHELLIAGLLKGHPLSQPILGSSATVQRIDRAALKDYLSRHYTPENVVLSIAGQVDFDRILPLIEAALGSWSGSTSHSPKPLPPLEPGLVARVKEIEQVHLCVGARGLGRGDPDKYNLFILDGVMGGSVSSRLFQKLREECGLVYTTGTNHNFYENTGVFTIYAGTSISNFPRVAGLINQELLKICEEPLAAEELNRAKEQLKGNLLLSLENTYNRMSRIAKIVLFNDELLTPIECVARVEAVTSAAVQQLARQIFAQRQWVLAAIGPFDPELKIVRQAYDELG